MTNPFLSVQKINKIFLPTKELQVIGLKDITLEINRAEFVVISGPSGSGKITLLNIIGGLDSPSSGEVILDGLNVTDLSEKEWSRPMARKPLTAGCRSCSRVDCRRIRLKSRRRSVLS